jgi:SAM-dependent methyltransferase
MEATKDFQVQTKSRTRTVNLLFAPTIFLSAFLLFCCEPMVGKMMLPLLGGAASVWITCLLFFQMMLLAGYAYTHALERYAKAGTQVLVHAALMLTALAFLPIQFAARPEPSVSAYPVPWLLSTLILHLALPFCIVSATAPLLQNWLSKTSSFPGKDPYFLYAISNAGSLLGLFVYPLAIEPRWSVRVQSTAWTAGYSLLLVLVLAAAVSVWRKFRGRALPSDAAAREPSGTGWNTRLFWLSAAFVPSGLMLAVTNHMLLNLASMPFLWVIPLAVYLMTFMIAFARRFHVPGRILSTVVPIVLLILFPLAAVSTPAASDALWYVLGAHVLMLFAGALLCHSSLAARRPQTSRLTEFYFWIALGGALGGIFVAVIAPVVFSTVIEYPLLVAAIAFFRETRETGQRTGWGDWIYAAALGLLVAATWYLFKWGAVNVTGDLRLSLTADALLALAAFFVRKRRIRFALALIVLITGYRLALPGLIDNYQVLRIQRDFFGIKKVVYDVNGNMRKLLHGDTLHGLESMNPILNGKPLSYYHETGPVGDVMKLISDRPNQQVAVVGLGTGTMAAWARPDRHVTFFDIDPQIYDIAFNFFTYLRRCAADCEVVIGDGRLSIERASDELFDVIMLDAFNSDSIPAHLVSREAVQMYSRKLKPDGLILFHVSNRYMDVKSLVSAVTLDAGLQGLVRYDDNEEPPGKTSSDYVVAAQNTDHFGELNENENWKQLEKPEEIQPWTDDYSNMLAIVRWR